MDGKRLRGAETSPLPLTVVAGHVSPQALMSGLLYEAMSSGAIRITITDTMVAGMTKARPSMLRLRAKVVMWHISFDT